ncbi:MAG: mechanosensitive ion channel [Bacteroidetes bacterium]|nr:mechanosensitive ion channel [Bacteroidota bacterium]
MKKYVVLLPVIILLSWAQCFSQVDSLPKPNDSLNTKLLDIYNQKIQETEQQRTLDSLKKIELENQISILKKADSTKRVQLEQQLQDLNNKENRQSSENKARIDSLRKIAKAYPVMGYFNDTLFLIYSRSGSFSAQDRADAITQRIEKLKKIFAFNTDSIALVHSESTIDLMLHDQIITSISEDDAIWNNTTQTELAEKYRSIIGNEVKKYKTATSIPTLVKECMLALLVAIVTGGLIYYLSKAFKWFALKLKQQEGKSIKGIKIRNYTLFDAKSQVKAVLNVLGFLKWLCILLVAYFALPILFGIFPWTAGFASTLIGYIIHPVTKMAHGFWDYLPNLITILVILVVFRYVLKGIYFLKSEIERGNLKIPGFYADWANPTYQIIKVIIFAFLLVVVFPYLPGSSSPVFQGVSVFLGFLFTFGSSGSLSNIVSGLVLTYMRLFKIGDRVKIGDVTGDVIEKSLLVTRIRTIKNEIITIPNSTVMNSHTINYSSEAVDKGLILHTTVTIGYDVPWKDMHQALLSAADRTSLLLKDPKPFVLQTSLDDFYVSYQINAYTKQPNQQANIYSDLHSHIQDCCNEAGIEIMSPHYHAARDGNASTVPASYLGKDYQAPPFQVHIKKEE